MDNLFIWIWLNIEMDLEAHWKVGCLEAFSQYQKYLEDRNLEVNK